VRHLVRSSTVAATAAALLALTPFAAVPALADQAQPNPGVARISLIDGDVGVRHSDAGDTVAAVLNAPLLAGDYLSTGDSGSDAELQVDAATLIRVGYSTQLRFTKLDSGERVAQLAQGTIEERVFQGGTPVAIDTPSVTIRPQGAGAYRIGVADDGSAQVTVRSGTLDILTPQDHQTLAAGHSANVSGDTDKPAIEVVDEVAKDDFDAFNEKRDAAVGPALADSPLPPAMAYDNYDRYGQWVQDPQYGQVWAPTEPPGWTPYSNGQWTWEGGYGWTWISYDPWGWGPYHYGRWFLSPSYGWCWYPPQQPAVAVWSPALVAFVGFGGGPGAGIAAIGWVPLAPREPFYPWYGWSGGVFAASTTVNVVNVSSVTYVNRFYGRQVTIDRWQAGSFGHPAHITPTDWEDVQVVHGALPVVPTRANLRFSNKPAPVQLAKAPISRPRFATLSQPAKTVPFEQVRSSLQTHVQSPERAPGAQQPAPTGNAWDRFDRPRPAGESGAPGSASQTNSPHGTAPQNTYHGAGQAPAAHGSPAPQHKSTKPPPQKKDDDTKKQ